MPLVTESDLVNAQTDAEDLGNIVGGAADLSNPGYATGTVTTRVGAVVKTMAKVAADAEDAFTALWEPVIFDTSAERIAGLGSVDIGQFAYDRETTQMYVKVDEDGDEGEEDPEWVLMSDLSSAEAATIVDLYELDSTTGRISVADYTFMREYEHIYEPYSPQLRNIKWPGGDSTDDGLAQAFGFSSWPTDHWGQKGTDYGLISDIGDLQDFTTHDNYIDNGLGSTYITIKPGYTNIITGLHVEDGYIAHNNTAVRPAYISDCYIDSGYLFLKCIVHDASNYNLYVERCELLQALDEGMILYKGHIKDCDIQQTQGDGLKVGGSGTRVDGNFIHKLGLIDITTHGDVIQVQDGDNMWFTRNTFYMPGTGTTYDEGSYGTSNVMRLVTENAAYSIQNAFVIGNIMLGGGYTLDIHSRFSGSLVENIVVANNIFGDDTFSGDYSVYGHITSSHIQGVGAGTLRNLILFNNVDLNGDGITYSATDQNGLWRYDKEYATPEFMELGKRYGYLDWNGDVASGVTNRTTS